MCPDIRTGWLEYFGTGLATQLREVQKRGEKVIRRNILVQKYHLSARQRIALEYALGNGRLTIQDYEGLCPGVTKRTLQRDLRALVAKGLLAQEGATNRLTYILGENAL